MPLVSMCPLPDKTMRPRIRWLLAALLVPCAMAQTPELDSQREYWRQQEEQRQEQQRRAQEEFQRQERATEEAKKKQQQSWDDDQRKNESARLEAAEAPSRQAQAAQAAQNSADLKAARARLLTMPPLPDGRNPLLGRWRVESDGKPQRKDELGLLIGMLDNPGGAACAFMFGAGIIEFKPKSWASIDDSGDDSLGPIAYRADGKRVFALPARGVELMGFDLVQANRVVVVNIEGCTLVRVAGTTTTTQSGESNRAPLRAGAAAQSSARTGAASSSVPLAGSAMPPVAAIAPTPPPASPGRPSPEICRNTLLDKLGTVGTNQVRAMSDVRFKEAAIEGKVPNTNNLRIDLRGSACDDPRIKATLYDFDANGMLQSITYLWERPPGPAPAPIYSERITQLSRFHSLPPPQSPGHLQADTSIGRLILEDLPERNLLLEAYKAPK